jgi:hypothetical protein
MPVLRFDVLLDVTAIIKLHFFVKYMRVEMIVICFIHKLHSQA